MPFFTPSSPRCARRRPFPSTLAIALICLLSSVRGEGKVEDLLDAAAFGQVDAVKRLIGQGYRVNDRNAFGESPLHLAAVSGKVEIVKAL